MLNYAAPDMKEKIRKRAEHCPTLWAFVHSTLMEIVEAQEESNYLSHIYGDGVFGLKLFDLNPAVDFLTTALKIREEYLKEKELRRMG